MNTSFNKHFYKVISLFIKTAILFFSFYFIWEKLKKAPLFFSFPLLFSAENYLITLAIVLLMFLNWSIEALKWKQLIAPLESITFLVSFKAIFSGITVSIFTPNRVGEFAGRVFFLEKADKIQGAIVSLIGSLMQLSVTLLTGVFAFFTLDKKHSTFFNVHRFFSNEFFLFLSLFLTLLIATSLYIFFKRQIILLRFRKYIDTFQLYTMKELNIIFLLSFIRYVVFSIQYYFALCLFGIHGELVVVFSLIALTFFVTSAIPTFALTEIAVRAGVAIYFFGAISFASSSIIGASLFIWIINLAVPAILGSPFVWKLKFFKE